MAAQSVSDSAPQNRTYSGAIVMITAKNMEELQRNVDEMRVAAANGTLTSGPVEVLLDRINTLRNRSYDTPYFRALEAMYAQVEALLSHCAQQAG